jgi:hypothetical protein
MKITNEINYPASVLRAAKGSVYKPQKDRIRVTELISPPLHRTLIMKHWDNIKVDVDDMLISMFGTAFHRFLAGYEDKDNVIFNQRFDARITGTNYILTGEPDKFNAATGLLEDYKTTSAWSFVYGGKEWEQQLNLYAYLLRKHGYNVTSLKINAFLRDWTYYQSIQKGAREYPKKRFHVCRIKLWNQDDTEKYITEKINDFIYNPERECTPKEKWEKPTTFAVMKDGRKSAMRVLPTQHEAEEWVSTNVKSRDLSKVDIVCRQGELVKCLRFCDVNKFCPYFKGGVNGNE